MTYYTDQVKALPASSTYKIQIRASGHETNWLNITPDQLTRIGAILAERDEYYVITSDDVGKVNLDAFGRKWFMLDVIGRIQPIDVGKRVYRRRTNAGDSYILQVENNAARDKRGQL